MGSLSHAQQVSLAFLPKISATLSIVASVWIVLEVLGDKEKQKQLYHRFMAMFAAVDVIMSFVLFLSTWPMQEETSGVVWSLGNDMTCNMQGFFIQFGSSMFFYVRIVEFFLNLWITLKRESNPLSLLCYKSCRFQGTKQLQKSLLELFGPLETT